jgi:hypothetical protein
MKHVIVIETVDEIAGGLPLKQSDQDVLERAVELFFEIEHRSCCVRSSFNQSSAIAAVHEMYNAPKWDPNAPQSQSCGCYASTNIADEINWGSGELDFYGFWEFPCTHRNPSR